MLFCNPSLGSTLCPNFHLITADAVPEIRPSGSQSLWVVDLYHTGWSGSGCRGSADSANGFLHSRVVYWGFRRAESPWTRAPLVPVPWKRGRASLLRKKHCTKAKNECMAGQGYQKCTTRKQLARIRQSVCWDANMYPSLLPCEVLEAHAHTHRWFAGSLEQLEPCQCFGPYRVRVIFSFQPMRLPLLFAHWTCCNVENPVSSIHHSFLWIAKAQEQAMKSARKLLASSWVCSDQGGEPGQNKCVWYDKKSRRGHGMKTNSVSSSPKKTTLHSPKRTHQRCRVGRLQHTRYRIDHDHHSFQYAVEKELTTCRDSQTSWLRQHSWHRISLKRCHGVCLAIHPGVGRKEKERSREQGKHGQKGKVKKKQRESWLAWLSSLNFLSLARCREPQLCPWKHFQRSQHDWCLCHLAGTLLSPLNCFLTRIYAMHGWDFTLLLNSVYVQNLAPLSTICRINGLTRLGRMHKASPEDASYEMREATIF